MLAMTQVHNRVTPAYFSGAFFNVPPKISVIGGIGVDLCCMLATNMNL